MVTILNLILYSDDSNYKQMRNTISMYLKTTGIQYYFYCYDDSIDDEYIIEGDLLKIKGVEQSGHMITLKTIEALKITLNFDYDYILRSNISTIINIPKLTNSLVSNPIEYGGGCVFDLTWLDPHAGINDTKYWNTPFVQGTAIIMSRNSVALFIDNIHKADTTIMDDVCIGVFFKQLNIIPVRIGDDQSFVWNAQSATNDGFFYRNKRADRKLDIYFMQKIIDTINSPQKSSPTRYISFIDHLIGRAYYGAGNRYIDVTDILFSLFVKDSHLFISQDVVFNDAFSNPVAGAKKLVYRSQKNIIIVNEDRQYDVDIDIMEDA